MMVATIDDIFLEVNIPHFTVNEGKDNDKDPDDVILIEVEEPYDTYDTVHSPVTNS